MEKSRIVKSGYSKIALKYHRQRGKYPNIKLISRFIRHIPKASRILDLGCGAGVPISKFLVGNGYQVTGVDFADGMLKLARKNVPGAKFMKMDITNLKFKPNSFDGAVSFYAIIHVPRKKHPKIYKRLHKILRPHAIMLLNASGTNTWEEYTDDYMGVPMFWSFYNPKKTLRIIRNEGFKILWGDVLKLGGEKQFWVLAENKK
ncbi:class I SAM-dependent methyltransferase [Candidatus Woesearchaeota archaeon]|nr:class I SAM-dependent methyltransferase [Candidatus Woesearchaeota archaeon]